MLNEKMIDGEFSFWVAEYGSSYGDARVVFRVRSDRTPKDRAFEKNIRGWDRLVPANQNQVAAWFESHQKFKKVNHSLLGNTNQGET